jgi:hypothetical protein
VSERLALSRCGHFLLAMIVGRDLDIEELRQETAPNALHLGVSTPEEWVGELQILLDREFVIRVPARDRFVYRATAAGHVLYAAHFLGEEDREAS